MTLVMMREPPVEPVANTGTLPSKTMMGVIELSGRLPAAISLAFPPIRPKALGTPDLTEKSSISLFSRMPVPRATMPEPKFRFSVYVPLTTLPFASITEKWAV